jgi:hypothetical protein
MFNNLLLAIQLEHDYMEDVVQDGSYWRMYSQEQRKKWMFNNDVFFGIPL